MVAVFSKLNLLAVIIIFAIICIFFIAIVSSILIRRKYQKMGQALESGMDRETGRFEYEVLTTIVNDYKDAAKKSVNEINTQAIIENNFNNKLNKMYLGERFIKNAVSLMIILGLLGTFYGLTLSIGKLVELLGSANAEILGSMDSIVKGLIDSVKGMSVAFVTSLCGIACSIILTVLNIVNNIEEIRESVMVKIEEYLDNKVAPEFKRNDLDKYAMITNNLRATFEKFGGNIEGSLKYVFESSGEDLAAATKEIQNSSLSLLRTVQLFDESLKRFGQNARDFSEFNHDLRTNIQRMNISFSDFLEGMDKKNN